MLIPVRCFTCNKVIANKWNSYQNDIHDGISIKDSLDKAGLKRYCCRRMFLGHVDLLDKMLMYSNYNNDSQSLE